jgi:hypothetical protein
MQVTPRATGGQRGRTRMTEIGDSNVSEPEQGDNQDGQDGKDGQDGQQRFVTPSEARGQKHRVRGLKPSLGTGS